MSSNIVLNQPPQTSKKQANVVYSGLLDKRGHFRKNWLTRLFILSKDTLEYYKQKGHSEGWVAHPSLKRGEILLSDIVSVESISFKRKHHCFMVKVSRRRNKKKTNDLDYLFQAASDDDKEKWIKHLRNGMRRMVDTVNLGKEVYDLLTNNRISTTATVDRTPADQAATSIADTFPILVQLLKDMKVAESERDLVYILDQIQAEVVEGAGGECIKKTLMTAAQVKLQHCPTIWTDPVKAAYGATMRAVQAQASFSQLEKQYSSQVSVGSDFESDLISHSDKTTFMTTYRCGRNLGAGATSVVRVAQHRLTQKQFAVKCIFKAGLRPVEVQALASEVNIMKSLEHENLVPLIDYFDEEDAFYIVTPLCTGGELFDELVKRECYTEEDAREMVIKLASAIQYLHSKGIVHRDLKPENILLKTSAPNAEIMIADFGFAKSTVGLHQGTACGTPGYIAPEIVNGHAYGTEVDCWSLGVILYILLCGYPPFPGENHVVILKKVAAAEYNFDSKHWDCVSAGAKDLVCKLLNADPKERLTAAGVLEHKWVLDQCNYSEQPTTLTRQTSDLSGALQAMRNRRSMRV